ncbi:unnamed protein product [Adineta steineri]|uniref:Mitochondrial pyruvate carrier n=1 Tax=Adineta steineri TaxID=433720 RepID=A0A814LJR8_9BILA|nr:unnamed protein product [Adineta steineri]CAF1067169.1 unnamed protein product [Adineta steineri]CAF3543377.1 unnamed protein product [Adineta steineri]CAF3728796.1 unnamed protein product [Adineta steineri]
MFILSDVYRMLIGIGDRALTPSMKKVVKWDHPAGPKYVHFWSPVMKSTLVVAGLGDLMRPAEKLSLNQSISLATTGLIWTRFCMVIVPKNYFLGAVNLALGLTGLQQVIRIAHYRYTNPAQPSKN